MLTQLTFSSNLPQSFSVALMISALYLRISASRLPTVTVPADGVDICSHSDTHVRVPYPYLSWTGPNSPVLQWFFYLSQFHMRFLNHQSIRLVWESLIYFILISQGTITDEQTISNIHTDNTPWDTERSGWNYFHWQVCSTMNDTLFCLYPHNISVFIPFIHMKSQIKLV